jgi:arabinose-5-phosphate isomerase
LPLAQVHSSLKQVVEVMGKTKGRPGAALIVDETQKLLGLFTDGDLRRMITENQHDFFVLIEKVMKKNPKTIFEEQMVSEALHLFHEFKVDQIPVIDTNNKAVGLLDVQELISLQAIG